MKSRKRYKSPIQTCHCPFDLKNEACGRPETLVNNNELKAIVEADETQSTVELAAAFNSEQVKLPGIYNEKRFYVKNAIHLSIGHVLGMDADNVAVEAQKCEVKDEPNDGEVISEYVLEENSVSDDVLSADLDTKNEESMGHVLEMDADSDGVETLVVLCDVKDEQSDPGDVSADVLEESRVSDCVPSADSHGEFLITVKVEQIGHRTSDSPPKEPTQDVQRSSEDTTSSNLNEHRLVQDTFNKLHGVTTADITDDNKEITASVQYTCDTCQQCYSSKRELEIHVRLCSDVWKKDLSCENTTSAQTHTAQKPRQFNVCNKRFSRIHHFTRYNMFAHTNEVSYHCYVCKKKFPQKGRLNRHIRTHTGEKPFHCDICKKQFTTKLHLIEHMSIHTGDKLYHCSICKKEFSFKSSLSGHMRIHTGEKPYNCDICKKQFSQRGNLAKHLRTHTGEKPYHCDICNRQFPVKDSLTKHMRTHTGEKPHQCYICKKQFTQKSTLTTHMHTHTGEKPYHCDKCMKQYSTKSHLNRHMTLKH